MAKDKMFDPRMLQDDAYLALTKDRVRMVYLQMRVLCTDDGLIKLSTPFLRTAVYNGKRISEKDIENDLKELEGQGLVVRYMAANNRTYGVLIRIFEQNRGAFPDLAQFPHPTSDVFERYPEYRDGYLDVVKRRRDIDEKRKTAKMKSEAPQRNLFPDDFEATPPGQRL